MAEYVAYFNGEWVPGNRIKVDSMDRGFMIGDTIYDFERTFNGKGFRLKEHIDRLYRSLKYVRIDPQLSPDEMLQISEEAVQRNEHLLAEAGDFTILQFVTRGPGYYAWNAGPPAVGVTIAPINFGLFAPMYTEGVHGVIARTRSYTPESLDAKVKHFSRMNFSLAELEANDVDPGAWAILTDNDGNVTEGTRQNVSIVTDGVLRTSRDRALLQGVSRGMLFELAGQLDIPVVEEDLQAYDLYTADEALFSSSAYCLLPMTQVDRRPIGDGKPGPIVQQLLAAWSESVGVSIVDQAQQFAR
jgi:branched-chain amino acid aminotransferase